MRSGAVQVKLKPKIKMPVITKEILKQKDKFKSMKTISRKSDYGEVKTNKRYTIKEKPKLV